MLNLLKVGTGRSDREEGGSGVTRDHGVVSLKLLNRNRISFFLGLNPFIEQPHRATLSSTQAVHHVIAQRIQPFRLGTFFVLCLVSE